MKLIWVLVFIQFFSNANASDLLNIERPIIISSLSTESTSDSINQQLLQIEYKNHRREPLWPYKNEAEKAWDLGVRSLITNGSTPYGNYRGALIAGSLGRKVSPELQLGTELGLLQTKNPGKQSGQLLIGGFTTTCQFSTKWTALLKINRDMAYISFGPGDAFSRLRATHISPLVIYKPLDQIKLIIKTTKSYLSDQNIRTSTEAVAMYGIFTGDPWIWIGLGGEKLGFRGNTEFNIPQYRYWSPRSFYSFGPRLDANLTMTSKLSFSLATNVSRIKEDHLNTGTGFLISPAFIYGSREDQQLKFSYMRIESRQKVSKWSNDTFAFTAQWSL